MCFRLGPGLLSKIKLIIFLQFKKVAGGCTRNEYHCLKNLLVIFVHLHQEGNHHVGSISKVGQFQDLGIQCWHVSCQQI